MTIKYVIIGIIIVTLMMSGIASAFAGSPRLDSPEDSTYEGGACWVDGYDSGFAGKYDKNRADECQTEENDEYNEAWNYACEDAGYTEAECNGFKNNPVEIEDYEALKGENNRTCYDSGQENGLAGKPYNKVRSNGCNEFDDIGGGYEGGYQFGCEVHTVESTCELKYEDKKYYCPNHPDVGGCAEFLHYDTNKIPGEVGPPNCANLHVICPPDSNPEKWCLQYNNPYCKFIGDICDDEGFVKPEYPYCTK
ncbi:MAG: hypothetical protein WBV84_11190 [Nitrososphaeraceae archaeon]